MFIFSSIAKCRKSKANCFWCGATNLRLLNSPEIPKNRTLEERKQTKTVDHLWPIGWFRALGYDLYLINPSHKNLVVACEFCNGERGSVLDWRYNKRGKISQSVIDKWNAIHISKELLHFVIERENV